MTRRDEVSTKVKDVLKRLKADGWYLVKIRGDHRQFKHPTKIGKVTVAGKPSDDVKKGTLSSIFRQAGFSKAYRKNGGKKKS